MSKKLPICRLAGYQVLTSGPVLCWLSPWAQQGPGCPGEMLGGLLGVTRSCQQLQTVSVEELGSWVSFQTLCLVPEVAGGWSIVDGQVPRKLWLAKVSWWVGCQEPAQGHRWRMGPGRGPPWT